MTRPGSVELVHSNENTVSEEKAASPVHEPKAKKRSRFDQLEPEPEQEEQTSQKESKEDKKAGKKNDWDMFAEADNFGTALNVSHNHFKLESPVMNK